jgi:hypothetical protein
LFDSFSAESADELYDRHYFEDYVGHIAYSNMIDKIYKYYNTLISQRQKDIFYLYLKSELNTNIVDFLKNDNDKNMLLEIITKIEEICTRMN